MEEIIKEAYSLFENYQAQSPLDICTDCCMDKKDEGVLASLPVKEIPKSLLMEYNDGAATAKTPINELKHFLPRYIELIVNFDFPSHSTEISLKRLKPFDREEWTSDEIEFLEKFAFTFFKKCISIHPLPKSEVIDSILIMFWRGQCSSPLNTRTELQIKNCNLSYVHQTKMEQVRETCDSARSPGVGYPRNFTQARSLSFDLL
ncbi:MAG: hypothetical protein AAGI38_10235 [Bacteroidota bacterium]